MKKLALFMALALLLAGCAQNGGGAATSPAAEPTAPLPALTPSAEAPEVDVTAEPPKETARAEETPAPTQHATAAPEETVGAADDLAQDTAAGPMIPAAGAGADLQSGAYDSYFDGTVFIGDSVTQGLENYVSHQKKDNAAFLGDVHFLATKSYMLRDASKLKVSAKHTMTYEGEKVTIYDGVERMGAKRAFILLGLNDWAGAQIERSIEDYTAIIENMQQTNPGVELIIQSVTPVCKERATEKINSRNMDAFNVELKKLCEEKGVGYIDVSTPLKDGAGNLDVSYSSDKYVHLNSKGLSIWVQTLRAYARDHSNN